MIWLATCHLSTSISRSGPRGTPCRFLQQWHRWSAFSEHSFVPAEHPDSQTARTPAHYTTRIFSGSSIRSGSWSVAPNSRNKHTPRSFQTDAQDKWWSTNSPNVWPRLVSQPLQNWPSWHHYSRKNPFQVLHHLMRMEAPHRETLLPDNVTFCYPATRHKTVMKKHRNIHHIHFKFNLPIQQSINLSKTVLPTRRVCVQDQHLRKMLVFLVASVVSGS